MGHTLSGDYSEVKGYRVGVVGTSDNDRSLKDGIQDIRGHPSCDSIAE